MTQNLHNQNNNISVVIPVYNEEKRLYKIFQNITDYLKNPALPIYEIIFVDDGSTDNTKQRLIEFRDKCQTNVILLSYSPNKGKGKAVKEGMLNATGDYILMCDADVSTPLNEISKFIDGINSGVHVLIGSRKISGANILKKQNWCRQKMGEFYAIISRCVTGLKIKDFGCGFKFFSQQSAKKIFSIIISSGWIFDTEALFLAKENNFDIEEIGIDWSNDEDSRVKIISGTFNSLIGLLYFRLYHSKLWKKISINSITK